MLDFLYYNRDSFNSFSINGDLNCNHIHVIIRVNIKVHIMQVHYPHQWSLLQAAGYIAGFVCSSLGPTHSQWPMWGSKRGGGRENYKAAGFLSNTGQASI